MDPRTFHFWHSSSQNSLGYSKRKSLQLIILAHNPSYFRIFTHNHAYSSRELHKFQSEHNISDVSKIKVQRFKGLGEMNPEELWDTTMEPSKRRLIRASYEDFASTDNMFSVLMGSEVEPRRKYIMDNYNKVQTLDI